MKLSVDKFIHNHNCNFKNFLRLNYDRKTDEILLKPCCGVEPIKNKKIVRVQSDYFLNNLNECIKEYEQSDIHDLYKHYEGKCDVCNQKYNDSSLCQDYIYNKKILKIENSISSVCNLRCVMCNTPHDYCEKEVWLYKEVTKKLKNYQLDNYTFTCSGEPFLYKDVIYDFLDNNNTKRIGILTNASLINEDDFIKLSKYDNLEFIVSIDSHIKETYEKIRVGSDFNKVVNNIIRLNEMGKLFGINYVAQELNKSEIPDAIRYFNNLKIPMELLSNDYIKKYSDDINVLNKCNEKNYENKFKKKKV